MDFRRFLKENLVRLDGGMGTLLAERGLAAGERPERWCLTHPEEIRAIHAAYFAAGANVVSTNTFGASPLHYGERELAEIVGAAVALARRAADECQAEGERFVALDIGPTGKLLRPLGDLDFEDAVSLFSATIRLGAAAGADLILIETMGDAYETKAAVLAAKESCNLPVVVSCAYGEDGRLLTGATPEAMVALLEGLGVDAIGANCSQGPAALAPVARALLAAASCPVLLKPNAGLPQYRDGKTEYDVTPATFATEVAALVSEGVRLFGGCCGTTPAHIAALTEKTLSQTPVPITRKERTVLSSYARAVVLGDTPILIGERINPTGKRRLKEALAAHDIGYLLEEAVRQEQAGAHVLDVNVGLPELDEVALLTEAVCEIQAITPLPLCLDTANPAAMEAALRRVNGKPLVNSVNGKEESLSSILPLVAKYGGVVIALTLDEAGIPATADGRLAIARRILAAAESYGIDRRDVIFDPLALTVAADDCAAATTLEAIAAIRRELLAHTSLGVSNISYGLPLRDTVSSAFLSLALANGLSAAIVNPLSEAMQRAYRTTLLLLGKDAHCAAYTAAAAGWAAATSATPAATPATPAATPAPRAEKEEGTPLYRAVLSGLSNEAETCARAALTERPPLLLLSEEVIPALTRVGDRYEAGEVFLPGLLISAEAAGRALAVIKDALSAGGQGAGLRGPVVLATVEGDIHDIGKNIVRLLLENYGFCVKDLGKDVPAERVLAEVLACHAPLCGLSALMTTTVPAMQRTVALLREKAPFCRTVVGGAVLTAEVAAALHADCYAPDALATVRYAETVCDTTRVAR